MKQLMEHRWNFRKQVETEVILDTLRLGVIRAKTHDVSYGGMHIDTRPVILNPNTKVRVTFLVRQETAGVTRQSLEALVVYMNGHGCGLMFEDFDRDTFTFLHTLMHLEAEDPAPRRAGSAARA